MSQTFIEIFSIEVLRQYINDAVKEAVSSMVPMSVEKTDNPLLTKKEAAKYLGVSIVTMSKYVKEGQVKAVTISGSRQRFWQEDLDKSLKAMRCYR
ncbi:MAG TPA: helix-turn-helix domain-containing protein [Sediminibacterium sp.]|jgi:excisionase family DNA binding protein|nr:helix-turn-helix domain-containing protein [Sediminibacterium sp.]